MPPYLLLSPPIESFLGKAKESPGNIGYSNYFVEMIPRPYSPLLGSVAGIIFVLPAESFSNSVKSASNCSHISGSNSHNSTELPSPKTHPKNNPRNSPCSPLLWNRIVRFQGWRPLPSCNSRCRLQRTIWSTIYIMKYYLKGRNFGTSFQ